MVLSASFTDKGGNNIKALPGSNSIALRSNNISFTGGEEVKGFTFYKAGDSNYLVLPQDKGWFGVDSIDLTGVRSVNLMAGWLEVTQSNGFDFENKARCTRLVNCLAKAACLFRKRSQKMGTAHIRFNP